MQKKTALVTGASSGIGESTAVRLKELGFEVYGAARRVDRLGKVAEQGVHAVAMDVTDGDSVRAAVERIIAETGRIDALVNNAGYGSYGAVEDVPLAEARRQFDVNLFGAAQLIQLVLPHMRHQRSGTIVNVSSVGGKIHTPMGGWYHATKFALEGFSDALRLETAPFGIDVVVVQPGGIRTEWGTIAAQNLRETSGSGAYGPQAIAMATDLEKERGSDPAVIADTIGKAVTARRPKTRYAAGMGAKPILAIRRALPDRAFDALIRRSTGAPA